MLSSLMVTAHCTGVRYFQNPIEDFQLEASRNHFDSMTPPLEQQLKYVKRLRVYACPVHNNAYSLLFTIHQNSKKCCTHKR